MILERGEFFEQVLNGEHSEMSATVLVERSEGVAQVVLNRPAVLNSVNAEMAAELLSALHAAAGDSEIRCVVLTGSGRAFCAGQDLADLDTGSKDPAVEVRAVLRDRLAPLVTVISEMDKPVVAAVNGVAAGAGASLALCCDLVVAKSSSVFIQSFIQVGLIPDGGATYYLPRLIGPLKARELAFLGDKVPAERAHEIGLVSRIFTEENFESEVALLCQDLAARPTRALALTKRALASSFNNSLAAQLALEEELQVQAASTADYAEGVRAFLEKRKAKFQGR